MWQFKCEQFPLLNEHELNHKMAVFTKALQKFIYDDNYCSVFLVRIIGGHK